MQQVLEARCACGVQAQASAERQLLDMFAPFRSQQLCFLGLNAHVY